jgi:hypothetical protein
VARAPLCGGPGALSGPRGGRYPLGQDGAGRDLLVSRRGERAGAPVSAPGRSSVGSFVRQYEAELACGRLVSEGIDAELVTVRRRGPWRVEVPREQEARAREVLAQDHSALLEELFGELEPGEASGRLCPRCGAGDPIDLREKPGLLFQVLGHPFWENRWRCRRCGTRWR